MGLYCYGDEADQLCMGLLSMEGGGGSRSKYTIYILVGMSSKLLAGAWPEIITSFEGAAALQKTFFFPFKVNQASFLECGAVREPVLKTSSRGETEDAGGRGPSLPGHSDGARLISHS